MLNCTSTTTNFFFETTTNFFKSTVLCIIEDFVLQVALVVNLPQFDNYF